MFILISWVGLTYLFPYIRSLVAAPVLISRYTIVVLPAILIAASYGMELIKNSFVRGSVIALFTLFSLTDMILARNFYDAVYKTQFREMFEFIVSENKDEYVLINEVTYWQADYYVRSMNIKSPVFFANKEDMVDSILQKTSGKFDVNGFWIVRASGDDELEEAKRKQLEEVYYTKAKSSFWDASAELFVLKSLNMGKYFVVGYDDFLESSATVFRDNQTIAIWGGAIQSNNIALPSGSYQVVINAAGTGVNDEFPHLNIYFNDSLWFDYYLTASFQKKKFIYHQTDSSEVNIKVEMDNDLNIPGEGDRNVTLKQITLEKIEVGKN
jgi:hypothetical protein